jgi:hypothetical protein
METPFSLLFFTHPSFPLTTPRLPQYRRPVTWHMILEVEQNGLMYKHVWISERPLEADAV